MSERSDEINAFLSASPYRDWKRHALAGDASARRYWRLSRAGHSTILMDASPPHHADTKPFAKIAQLLTAHGLCAPDVLAHDGDRGLMLLSDLGDAHFAEWLVHHPDDQSVLYRSAVAILLRLETVPAPEGMTAMTPSVGAKMINILSESYMTISTSDLEAQMERALTAFAPDPTVLALRDYHAENLIWRQSQTGLDRVGLLDFQDAFLAPAGYDLASLLRDARRDVPQALAQDMISYFSERSTCKHDLGRAVACLGVQRNLRILGVFARLAKQMGKQRYLAFMPRVWRHIMNDLKHPDLSDLSEAVMDTVPLPTPTYLEGLTR